MVCHERLDPDPDRHIAVGGRRKGVKGTGHFFETLSVGSLPGTDHS